MSNINTGGPAFPCETIHPCGSHEQVDGLSIRDYFAAKAMQAYMQNEVWRNETYKQAAKQSYAVADAMLKARNG